MTPTSDGTRLARLSIVDEHVRLENEHNLDGVMETFGETARYDDEPWDAHYIGRQQVRQFYTQLLEALPDLHIDVRRRHAAEEAVLLEVIIRGRHFGTWRGLPATGRQINFPLCGVYTFDKENRLSSEKIYYDRATVLQQLGIFYEPESFRGRIITVVTHPLTVARIITQKIFGARSLTKTARVSCENDITLSNAVVRLPSKILRDSGHRDTAGESQERKRPNSLRRC